MLSTTTSTQPSTTNSHPRFGHVFKVAIELNNIGVTLLVRGHFKFAVRALHDSLMIMEQVEKAVSIHASSSMYCARTGDVDTCIWEFARQKLQTCYRQTSTLTPLNLMQLPQERQFHLDSFDSNDFKSLASKANKNHPDLGGDNGHGAIFIRESSPSKVRKIMGIMLFNYGLACSLLSKFTLHGQSSTSKIQRKHSNDGNATATVAYKSLLLAYSYFAEEGSGNPFSDDSEDDFCEHNLVQYEERTFFSILCLSCVQNILQDQNEIAKADEAGRAIRVMLSSTGTVLSLGLRETEELAAIAA